MMERCESDGHVTSTSNTCDGGTEDGSKRKITMTQRTTSTKRASMASPGIPQDLIRKGTKLKQYAKGETEEHFFERITSLSLHGRNIDKMNGLEICPKLRILFLYNNNISSISNISFARHLSHLYLENNDIREIGPELRGLRHLTKLSLDGNRISCLSGLEGCVNLQEIHINSQRLEPGEQFSFDIGTMESISESLCIFTANNSNIMDIQALTCLMNLQTLRLGKNLIYDMAQVVELVSQLTLLQELELEGNPVSTRPKYRDTLITKSELLQIIDDKPVKPNERAFLQARDHRRRQSENLNHRASAISSVHRQSLSKNNNHSSSSDHLSSSYSSMGHAKNFAFPRKPYISKTPIRTRAPKTYHSPPRASSTSALETNFSSFLNVGQCHFTNK